MITQMDPALLGLPSTIGSPPSKAFAALPGCRKIPGSRVSLTVISSNAEGVAREEHKGDNEVLEVQLPPASVQGTKLRLSVMDIVMLRVSSLIFSMCIIATTVTKRCIEISVFLISTNKRKPRSLEGGKFSNEPVDVNLG